MRLGTGYGINGNIATNHAPNPTKIYLPDQNNNAGKSSNWVAFPVIVDSGGKLMVALPKSIVDQWITQMETTDLWQEYNPTFDNSIPAQDPLFES